MIDGPGVFPFACGYVLCWMFGRPSVDVGVPNAGGRPSVHVGVPNGGVFK